MPARSVDVEQPFQLGLDSMMAMTVLKQTQQLAGTDLASMLWNHPTIAQLANHLAEPGTGLEPVKPALKITTTTPDSAAGCWTTCSSVESAPGRSESSSL
jgi:aryl carrier-like protein